MIDSMPDTPQFDFFVSRTGADAAWAQWIAWQLEATGYKVVLQDWDFGPGVNFVGKMQQASTDAKQTIAVLSERYFQSRFTEAEWAAAFYQDRLLPIRIENFQPPGLFGPLVRLDLFDLDPDAARQRLLEWIGRVGKLRGKPENEPAFPGKPQPNFPGRVSPMFGLPARNRNFTGRESLLTQLRNHLAAGSAAALHGLVGNGKSQIAIEYAWRWASTYSRIVWLQAETSETLGRDFDALANDLNLFNGNKPAEREVVIKAVCNHLEQNPGWLLIFDNAPDPRAVEHAVPRAGGHVIFTSRYTAWGKQAASLRVDVWPPEEAEQFLLKFAAGGEEQDSAAQLAQELGYLPLALQHVAAYCGQSGLSLAGYLPLFRKRRLELFEPEVLSEGQDPDGMITVTTTWNLSLDRIRGDERCPEAGALFNLCAFFGPDRIPLEMIRKGTNYLPKKLSAALRNDLKANAIISVLLRYSLVSVGSLGEERVLSIHRLLQEVTRKRLAQDERIRWITAGLQIVWQAFPSQSDEVGQWPECGRLAPHALAVLQFAELRNINAEVTAALLNELALYAKGRAEYSTAEPLYQRSLAILEKVRGPAHPDTSNILNNLAEVYREQGRYEKAEPLYQRALAIRETVLGQDQSTTATILNDMAELSRAQGRYEEAETLYQRALAIYEKLLGPDHPNTATSLNNLALLYHEQGRHKTAEPLCQQALAIYEKALGPDHPRTANSLNNLAMIYGALGRYSEAESLQRRDLAISEKALGPDHPATATSLHNLAALCDVQGRHEVAVQLVERALAIREKALGPDHPDTATTRKHFAAFLRGTGRDAEAAALEARKP